ncbi:MAG: ankyrin repeat domain-containing protein [Treponemataceae bacterium]
MKRKIIALYFVVQICSAIVAQSVLSQEELNARDLYAAVLRNDFASVSFFLEQGANIHAQLSPEGYEYLLPEYIKLINPSPQFSTAQIATLKKLKYHPLHIAALQNNSQMISLFIKYKSNINVVTAGDYIVGFTPLMLAVMNNNIESVALLLKHNADVLATNAEGKNATMIAIEQNNDVVAGMLLKKKYHFNINEKIPSGDYPLLIAIRNGNVKLVKHLIAFGANINLSSSAEGAKYPIILAIEQKNLDIVQLLIKHKVDLSILENGMSVFLFAVTENNLDIVKLLVKNKVNIAASVKGSEKNALFLAVEQNNLAMAQYLIAIGVTPYSKDNEKRTPLMIALHNKKMTELLLAATIPNNKTKEEPLLTAKKAIDAIDSKKDSALLYAIKGNFFDAAELLIQKGASVNTQNEKGETPLSVAIENAKFAKLLIDNGAAINVKDAKGLTPLMYAAFDDAFLPTVMLLVEAGADINATTADASVITSLIKIIEGENALTESSPNFVYSPLLIAKKRGAKAVQSYLIEKGAR